MQPNIPSPVVMGLNALLPLDDLDTRREIMYLFSRLLPDERVQFLRWCTVRVNSKLRHNPEGEVFVYIEDTTEGHVAESYFDFMALIVHYGLDWQPAVQELERRGRKRLVLPTGAAVDRDRESGASQ